MSKSNARGIRRPGGRRWGGGANTLSFLILACTVLAQGPPPPGKGAPAAPVSPSGQKVTINYLNVCAPSEAEGQQISAALARIPRKPALAADFEISHGRLRVKETGVSHYVRLRREMEGGSPFLSVQYSISADEKNIDETLSFRSRDARDVLQVSIEDRVSAGAAAPGTVVASNTPASHVNVERFGKPSVGLARCAAGDQAAYQKTFDAASAVLQHYREELGLRTTFKSDLRWLDSVASRLARHGAKLSDGKAAPAGVPAEAPK